MEKVIKDKTVTTEEFKKLNSTCIISIEGEATEFKEFIVVGVTADDEHLQVICQGGISLIINAAKEMSKVAQKVISELPIAAQLGIALELSKDDE